MGAWVAYGLGSANENLPSYIVLLSRGTGRAAGQPLYDRLWGSGVFPGKHQGVKLRSGNDPILYLTDPAGCPSPGSAKNVRRYRQAESGYGGLHT